MQKTCSSAASGGLAAPVGFAVMAHGFDQFFTGVKTFVTGRHNSTATSQLLQKAGMSAHAAHFMDDTCSLLGTMGASYLGKLVAFSPIHKTFNYTTSITQQNNIFSKITNVPIQSGLQKTNIGGINKYRSTYSPHFIVGEGGVTIPTSRSVIETGFMNGNFKTFATQSKGKGYILPNGNIVRIMESTGHAPLRASFTNINGGPINPFTGKPPQPFPGLHSSTKKYVRSQTHLELYP